jgi:hypothetical protein
LRREEAPTSRGHSDYLWRVRIGDDDRAGDTDPQCYPLSFSRQCGIGARAQLWLSVSTWSKLEDQDPEVLVHPQLLVRVAALGVFWQLGLDGFLNP